MKQFEKPKYEIVELSKDALTGKYQIEPLERGFGLTLGNALRRVMLSSLPGAAVYAVAIEGAKHEFSALKGVVEDVTAIILNVKELVLVINEDINPTPKLEIDVKGPCEVTGNDIICPAGVEVFNKDAHIATVAEGGEFKATFYAKQGRGFVTAEQNKKQVPTGIEIPLGAIFTDSKFSPVEKIEYSVDSARVGNDASYDKLVIDIKTNGGINPQEAIALAAKILVAHFEAFVELSNKAQSAEIMKETVVEEKDKFENMPIEELELSVRSYNCLKRAGIQTVLELTQKTEDEMMKVRNLGKKSLKEIKDVLAGLNLGFKVSE